MLRLRVWNPDRRRGSLAADTTEGPASYSLKPNRVRWMHVDCAAGEGYEAPEGWRAVWRER